MPDETIIEIDEPISPDPQGSSPPEPAPEPSLSELATLVVTRKRGCGRAVAAQLVKDLDDATLQQIVDADEEPGGDQIVNDLLAPPDSEEPT